jgi:hypothetical protein
LTYLYWKEFYEVFKMILELGEWNIYNRI